MITLSHQTQASIIAGIVLLERGGRKYAQIMPVKEKWYCYEHIDLRDTSSKQILQKYKEDPIITVQSYGATPVKAVRNFLKLLPRRLKAPSPTQDALPA